MEVPKLDSEQQAKVQFVFSKAPRTSQSSQSSEKPAFGSFPASASGFRRPSSNSSFRNQLSANVSPVPNPSPLDAIRSALPSASLDINPLPVPFATSFSSHHELHEDDHAEGEPEQPNSVAIDDSMNQDSITPSLTTDNKASQTASLPQGPDVHKDLARKKIDLIQERITRMTQQKNNQPPSSQLNFVPVQKSSSNSILVPSPSLARSPQDIPNASQYLNAQSTRVNSPVYHQPSGLVSHARSASPSTSVYGSGLRLSRSINTSFAGSRAGSVDDSNRGLPAVLAEAMRSAETWSTESQEMRTTIERLEMELQVASREKEELRRKTQQLEKKYAQSKATAIANIRKASERVEELKADFESFKKPNSEAASDFTAPLSEEITKVKADAQHALQVVESFFDINGNYNFKAVETKDLLRELDGEITFLTRDCEAKQQVIDLLRERLEAATGELVEQKERSNALETAQARNTEELRELVAKIADMGGDRAELKKCQIELLDALARAGELQNELSSAKIMCADLEAALFEQKEKYQAETRDLKDIISDNSKSASEHEQTAMRQATELRHLSEQCSRLQSELNSSRHSEAALLAKVEMLIPYGNEIQELRALKLGHATIPGLHEEIKGLTALNSTLKLKVETLEGDQLEVIRLREVEADFSTATKRLDELSQRYESLVSIESSLRDKCSKLEGTKDAAEARLSEVEERFKESLAECQDKLLDALAQNKMFEQQLELQSTVAQKEREDISAKCSNLQSQCEKKDTELAALRTDLKVQLEHRIEDAQFRSLVETLESDASALREKLATTESELDSSARLVTTVAELESQLSTSRANEDRLTGELKASNDSTVNRTRELENERKSLNSSLEASKTELAQAKAQAKDDWDRFQKQITILEDDLKRTGDQFSTFISRYEAGEHMNEQECRVIQEIMQHCQRSVEQQLVVKGNEIRRRDNIIKNLEGRIKSLESMLAKHLDTKAKANADAGIPSRSLINPNYWVSSSPPEAASGGENTTMTDQETVAPAMTLLRPPIFTIRSPLQPLPDARARPKVTLASLDVGSDDIRTPETGDHSQLVEQATTSPKRRMPDSNTNANEEAPVSKKARISTRSATASADREKAPDNPPKANATSSKPIPKAKGGKKRK